jgi:hypothetical protein
MVFMDWLKRRRIDKRSLSLQPVQSPVLSDSGQCCDPPGHAGPSGSPNIGQQVHCRGIIVKTVSKMSLSDEFVCLRGIAARFAPVPRNRHSRHEFRGLTILDGCFDTALTFVAL